MLTCREMADLVTEYVEGRMSVWERLRFQLHLGMCKACREYVRQLELTVDALGELPPVEMPPEVEQELRSRFASWKAERGARGTEPAGDGESER